MHAPSDPGSGIRLGKRVAFAALTLLLPLLAACGGGSSDNPALPPPGSTPGTVAAGAGPAVTVSGSAPQLAGYPAANAVLRRDAAALDPGCHPATQRDDAQLVSFRWTCRSERVAAAATIALAADRQLRLSDLLAGAYVPYLQSVAEAQFRADGISHPSVGDLSVWYLTPASLVVVFASGPVGFPLSSLTPYLRDPALFG